MLSLIRETPGITVPELSEGPGAWTRPSLYRVVRKLQSDGSDRQGRQGPAADRRHATAPDPGIPPPWDTPGHEYGCRASPTLGVIGAMSYALDVTEGEPPGHAVRACKIGMRLAQALELDAGTRSRLFYALLLKDAGCSANSARMAALFGADDHVAKRTSKRVDWSGRLPAFVWSLRTVAPGGRPRADRSAAGDQGRGRGDARADAGPLRPRRGDRAACWDSRPRRRRRSARSTSTGTAAASRAACAARRSRCSAGSCASRRPPRSSTPPAASGAAWRWRAGGAAAGSIPRSSTRSATIRDDAAFWASLADGDVAAWEPADRVLKADDARLDAIAAAFAAVVDAKSPWTYRHSDRVCLIVMGLASALGADVETLRDLRRAALLHDIGKLAISNRILDKPGTADARRVRADPRAPAHHRADPGRVPGCEHLAAIAGAHHERLDGGGYPRGVSGDELTLPMRVLAIADVYEALTSDARTGRR